MASDQKISGDGVQRKEYIDGVEVPVVAPPGLNGERGHTGQAAAGMHSMAFRNVQYPIDQLPVTEQYDLVVVGAGLSGLSAAFFYRERFGNDKKILILDPLEDFGGHAKRNELLVDGKRLIGYGGSESLQSPKTNFTEVTHKLMKALGISCDRFHALFDQTKYPALGLSRASFFDQQHFGKDALVKGDPTDWVADDIPRDKRNAQSIEAFISGFPVSDDAKKQLVNVYTGRAVTLSHLPTRAERVAYLSKTSYAVFLRTHWGLGDEALRYFRQRTLDFFGLSPEFIPALDAGHYAYPGFQAIDLPPNEEAAGELEEPYIYHFPDGNASVARLIVRSLIPGVAPGKTMEDIVLARFDYSKLDQPNQPVRLRLQSTAVNVANVDGHVRVGVFSNVTQAISVVQAKHCILACFNMSIPYILKGMEPEQAAALKQNVKVPLIYSNVAVRNWHPWVKLGVHDIYGVGTYHSRIKLDYPVTIGSYACPKDPSEPILIHMVHVPVIDGAADPRTALRSARKTFFGKKFAELEHIIRSELTQVLGPGGFNAEKDIAAITLNRWSHGYAWVNNTLLEDEEKGKALRDAARKAVGNVSIANSDSAWNPYAHSAIDEAFRAVHDLKAP